MDYVITYGLVIGNYEGPFSNIFARDATTQIFLNHEKLMNLNKDYRIQGFILSRFTIMTTDSKATFTVVASI